MSNSRDQREFERVVDILKGETANLAAILTLDSSTRLRYSHAVNTMADDLRRQAKNGLISWNNAATQANTARNAVLDIMRGRSTPVGLAFAQKMKSQGKTLNELIARNTQKLFGTAAEFEKLTTAQQNAIFKEVVDSAGRSSPRVNIAMQRLSKLGRGLIVLSLALSVYNVASAEDKVGAAGKEVAVTGAGIAGGFGGGALAGLACGPGAPVCVTVGAFVGGALAAFGISMLW